MTARRVIGLLTTFLMLHLTLVGADLRCGEHGDQAGGDHSAASTSHAAMTRSADASAATDQPCQTPTQPECCRAMTSCAINATLHRDTSADSLPPVRYVIATALTRLPSSPVTSPDPPPPKA